MRITGGCLKGRALRAAPRPGLRPTRALVREAAFSVLGPDGCRGMVFADFYSGSGIIGLEAVSRGAARVYSVEQDPEAVKVLRDNLRHCLNDLFPEVFEVLALRAERAVEIMAARQVKVDIVYLDPPYREAEPAVRLLHQALRAAVFSPGAKILFEHAPGFNLSVDPGFTVLRFRKYGNTALTLLTLT
ncbi:MAG: 16S rRNA (guanine(966)-N(2))-methyltransferase RsmD [Deltaproteobacteria bacterium]|nr:16S rRNA (guanine(966)-N(2))-methyltransferase RsmD [Deltaproteobacteria bacterium]